MLTGYRKKQDNCIGWVATGILCLLVIIWAMSVWVGEAWGEEPAYRIQINKKADMEDIRWLFNEVLVFEVSDPIPFEGREQSFTLTEVE